MLTNRLHALVPELFSLNFQTPLFNPSSAASATSATPASMAAQFQVPYLGKIPMDPNMLLACERGVSFAEAFPSSPAAPHLRNIVEIVVAMTKQQESAAPSVTGGDDSEL